MKQHLVIPHFDSVAAEAIKPHNMADCATTSCSEKGTKVFADTSSLIQPS